MHQMESGCVQNYVWHISLYRDWTVVTLLLKAVWKMSRDVFANIMLHLCGPFTQSHWCITTYGRLADMSTRRRPVVARRPPLTLFNYVNSTWLTHTTWTPVNVCVCRRSVSTNKGRGGLTPSPEHSCTALSPASVPAAATHFRNFDGGQFVQMQARLLSEGN